MSVIPQFPHCDQRVLHAPGECEFCDGCPEWQALRKAWGIAFTGKVPAVEGDRCGKRILDVGTSKGPHFKFCMQAAGHGSDVPCSEDEPWERLPCPADVARPPGSSGDSQSWPGNRPGGYASDIFKVMKDQIRRSRPRELGEGDD